MDSLISLLVTIFVMGLVVLGLIFTLLWFLLMTVINGLKGSISGRKRSHQETTGSPGNKSEPAANEEAK